MNRLKFDSQGKLEGIDGKNVDVNKHFSNSLKQSKKEGSIDLDIGIEKKYLKKSEKKILRKIDNSEDTDFWSLYKNNIRLEPLKFSNGKTQEDIVREIVELNKKGRKIIFLHGMCGTGKSAIALNLARCLGKTSIVVPVKNLQRQYEEDYMGNMFVCKKNGEELSISIITGRDNHDSMIEQGKSCADSFLPDTIQITEKNFDKLKEYYENNPLIKSKEINNFKQLRRISIAPANPYWSPIIPAEYEFQLKDAVKKRYLGLGGREFIFYHRKRGCSYFDQYQSYINSEVIIFNSAKYKIEVTLDRKPETEIDIIDEADEFLDSFSNQMELNLTRLKNALNHIVPEDNDVRVILDTIKELLSFDEKRIRAVGIDEDKIHHINDTNLGKILRLFLKDRNVESEISLDDANYGNKAIETAKQFIDFLDETYLTFRRHEENIMANLVTTNLSKRLDEIIAKNKCLVFMSGTLHSKEVLENVFGIKNYAVVEAETKHQGQIEIIRTGMEFNCSYRNFNGGGATRKGYIKSLSKCVDNAENPILIHVNAFEDLPSEEEVVKYDIGNLMSKEELINLQRRDKTGRLVSIFKSGMSDILYSTKCSRGVDFPGDMCKAMIFTKFPYPNIRNTFWKILEKTHPDYYWSFYRDKARREFLQRLYRALRSKDDHIYILSPDLRVIDKVREMQIKNFNN